MGGGDDADDNDRGVKRGLKSFLMVLLVWLLFIGNLTSTEGFATAKSTPAENIRHAVFLGKGRHHVPANSDSVNVSKRRVPSGPDPIHNRHVGVTRRPPGRT